MLTKFSAKLHTFHWNSSIAFGKYWKLHGNSDYGFQKNRVISDLITCIFPQIGLFPSEFQFWNGIVETYHFGNIGRVHECPSYAIVTPLSLA